MTDRAKEAATTNEMSDRKISMQGAWRNTQTCRRTAIGDEPIAGPLLIEEDYSVLLIEPGWQIRALDGGSLMATRHTGDAS